MRLPHLIALVVLVRSASGTEQAPRSASAESRSELESETAPGRASGSRSEAADLEKRLEEEEQKLDLLNEKLSSLERELGQLDSRQTTLLGELHRLDLQVRIATEQLELLKLELQRGYRQIDENLARIRALEERIEELKPYLERRSVSLYKLGRMSYLRLLLSVEEPSELTRAYRYVSRLAREDGKKMSELLANQRALETTKADLLEQTERMLATRKQLETTTRSLERRRASRSALLAEITKRRELAGTLLHELEQARERLGRLVESLAARESTDLETVHLPMRAFEGEIAWPVDGELEGRFGKQLHPRFRTVTVRNGIELEAPRGTTVHAVYQGEVVFASWFEGYGNLLILRHPGDVHTLYGFLADFRVAGGDWVDRGASVGWVGDTDSLAGPRLYFEVRVDGKPVNPEGWLDPGRRLANAASN